MKDLLMQNLVDLAQHSGKFYDDNTVLCSLHMPLHVQLDDDSDEEEKEDTTDRLIHGIVSTHKENRQGTVVNMDALSECCDSFLKTNHSLLLEHDRNAAIGSVLQMKTMRRSASALARVGHGFSFPWGGPFEGKVMRPVDDVWMQMQQDVINSFSLGMLCSEEPPTKKDGPPQLIPRDLLELSGCTIPANRDTQFAIAHAFAPRGPGIDLLLEHVLPTPTPEPQHDDDPSAELDELHARLREFREESQVERFRKELTTWKAQH